MHVHKPQKSKKKLPGHRVKDRKSKGSMGGGAAGMTVSIVEGNMDK